MIKYTNLTIECVVFSDYENVSSLHLFARKINFITLTQDVGSASSRFFIIHTYLLSMNSGGLDSDLVNNNNIILFAILTRPLTQ